MRNLLGINTQKKTQEFSTVSLVEKKHSFVVMFDERSTLNPLEQTSVQNGREERGYIHIWENQRKKTEEKNRNKKTKIQIFVLDVAFR